MKVGKVIKRIVREQAGLAEDVKIRKWQTASMLGLDSLDEIEVIMCVEEEFDIGIKDCEAMTISSVGQLIEMVKWKLKHEA
jgi:acyl carrier protein